MSSDASKRLAAEAAIDHVEEDTVIGVGTGSTVNHFIDALSDLRDRIRGCVSSSSVTTERLRERGIEVLDLNSAGRLPLYVDGCDESNRFLQLVKGGGGALTGEKIIASASDRFVCIADEAKLVDVLGAFPLPVEVLPMARSTVAREIVRLGGRPELREGFTTDHGNIILDVHGLSITEPRKLEQNLNNVPGVVSNGLFALRPADLLLVGGGQGVRTLRAQ